MGVKKIDHKWNKTSLSMVGVDWKVFREILESVLLFDKNFVNCIATKRII